MNEKGLGKYAEDGVNIDVGDIFSKQAYALGKETYGISPFVKILDLSQGRFRGPRGFNFINLPEGFVQSGAADGIGTKVVLIDAAKKHLTGASNVIAMTAMDLTRYGGLPLIFFNVLDVDGLGTIGSERNRACNELILGLHNQCMEHRYVMLTGETAEVGLCVGSENPDATVKFNWAGVMLGVYHPDKMILGNTLRPGQVVMALRDFLRSNGISSVRKAIAKKYGPTWWNNPEAMIDIIAAAEASVQYDRFLNHLHGWDNNPSFQPLLKMHSIVHLSGGAFKSKLGEDILEPQELSANLDSLFEPPEIMKKCAEWRGVSDEECYETWNGGQGALVVIDEESVGEFLRVSSVFGIEAKVAGKITKKTGDNVTIRSMFNNEIIHY